MGIFGGRVLRVAFAVSKLGERIGSPALIYNPGVFWHFHSIAKRMAPGFAEGVLEDFGPLKSVADVGCGTGAYAAEFKKRGVDIYAGEFARLGRTIARLQGIPARPFDVTNPSTALPRTFELAYSIEVAEHIPPSLADAFVDYMCSAAPRLILTAAHPGQGGHGHLNEQPQGYWIAKFAERGFACDAAAAGKLSRKFQSRNLQSMLSENLMVFSGTPKSFRRHRQSNCER